MPSGNANAEQHPGTPTGCFVEHFAKFLRFKTGFPSNGAVDGVPNLQREHASPEFLECGSFLGAARAAGGVDSGVVILFEFVTQMLQVITEY
jgi:hypothetical protein